MEIYLAISGASSDTMDEETYRANFLQYDRQILAAASKGAVNVFAPPRRRHLPGVDAWG